MKEIKTSEDFKVFLDGLNGLGVVHFWAEWAAQCGQMEEVMEELGKDPKLKDVQFVRVVAESAPEVSMRFKIIAVPTVILLRDKEMVDRVDGANAAELTKKVRMQAERVSLTGPAQVQNSGQEKEDLNTRLKKLINMSPAVLFMKGNPEQPRCGFSKQVIALLNSLDAQFSTFDILQDEEVRQGLKTYSDWPTYPQLYVKGELIGGLDIMKEMKESGELGDMLPKKKDLNSRLKELINRSPVMIFMKGNPKVPKCGFSRTLIGILENTKVSYDTFDILEDEEVRQGLKTYSDWPTYPQVYVKGALVGGLDIIKELEESGELAETLKG